MASSTGSALPGEQPSGPKASDLTPLRAHYLKKALIQLQFGRELDLITSSDVPNVSNLSFLGPPFSVPPTDTKPLDLPFLKFVFRQFVLTFPFMEAAPKGFYSEKVQPFVDAMLSRNLASSSLLEQGQSEEVSRRKLLAKVERNMGMFLGSATKLVEREDIVRLTQTDLDRLERLAEKRQRRLAKNKESFQVNIIGVRTIVEKGRVRSRAHEEFIIRTRRSRYHDVYVSRRYGDFKTLANELAKRYPDENIRLPPPKDRTVVNAPSSASPSSLNFPQSSPSASSRQSWDGPLPDPTSPSSRKQSPDRLAREKNRLTLRSYLNSLLSSYTIASSPVLKSFLLMGAITLGPEELEDARRREEADRVREEGRKRFAKEIAGRVDGLRDAVKSVKGDVMGKDGLTHVFGVIKVTPEIKDLPENFHAVVEWARISLASTAFHTFVASDDASETFAGLKRIHGLMPYFMLKGALKITNPIAMIRTVLDLFLAQLFGGRSLLQRMFTSTLSEEIRVLEEDIEAVKDKVDDPIMCDKIRQFVYAPREIQEMFRVDAASENMNIITVVLRSSEAPVLSRAQMHRLARAHKAHMEFTTVRDGLEDSDDDDGPQNDDAWLIEDLRVLTHKYQRLRDREQLIALIFEGFTSELLRDIITIFYSPLAKVYRAASIADSVGDLQNFITDLIRTVEQVEEVSQEDSHRTVQAFVNLIQRHEQSFYHFVHNVHSKGEGLFDSLMHWIELFLTVIREGLGPPLSLEFLLPHQGKERAEILAEIDKVALHHYKLKVLYEERLRRRFGRAAQGDNNKDADGEDEAARLMVNGVIGEINFGELVQGDAIDLAAADTDEESATSSNYDSDEDTDESTSASTGSESSVGHRFQPSLTRHPSLSSSSMSKNTVPAQVGRSHPKVASSAASFQRTETSSAVPIPQPPVRKRSLSLKRMKSLNFSLNGISMGKNQDSKLRVAPPVPPLPESARNASSPISQNDGPGLIMPQRSWSNKTIRPGSASSSSAYVSASGSTASLHRLDVNTPLLTACPGSPLTRSAATTPVGTRPSTPQKSPRTAAASTPGSSAHSPNPAVKNAVFTSSSAGPIEKSDKQKKKKAQPHTSLEPPELIQIPKLLPVFVEMMRPLLRPRKITGMTPN